MGNLILRIIETTRCKILRSRNKTSDCACNNDVYLGCPLVGERIR